MAEDHPELSELLAAWRGGRIDQAGLDRLAHRLRDDPAAADEALHAAALHRALARAADRRRIPAARPWWRWAIAAILLAAAGGLWRLLQPAAVAEVVLAGAVQVLPEEDGQQRLLLLQDHSAQVALAGRITLGTEAGASARIRIERSDHSPVVQLLSGTLSSRVRPDSGPFLVTTASGSVAVTGTSFSVQILEQESAMSVSPFLVRVVAGSVLVSGSWGQQVLSAGEAETFPPVTMAATRLEVALAQRLTLELQDTSLAAAVEWLQKNTGIRIVVAPELVTRTPPDRVTLSASGVTAGQAIAALAWQNDLWVIAGGREILISDQPDRRRLAKVYSLADLPDVRGSDGLREDWSRALAAQAAVAQPPPICTAWNHTLVVDASQDAQRRIETLLAALRALGSQRPIDASRAFVQGRWQDRDAAADDLERRPLTIDLDHDLPTALQRVSAQLAIPVVLHHSLRAAGPRITLQARDLPLDHLLAWLSRSSGTEIALRDGFIYAGPGAARFGLTIRAYQLFGDPADYHQLYRVASRHAGGDWGPGAAWALHSGDALLVGASEEQHAAIRELFTTLRLDAAIGQPDPSFEAFDRPQPRADPAMPPTQQGTGDSF